jgi:hypothetical protein
MNECVEDIGIRKGQKQNGSVRVKKVWARLAMDIFGILERSRALHGHIEVVAPCGQREQEHLVEKRDDGAACLRVEKKKMSSNKKGERAAGKSDA